MIVLVDMDGVLCDFLGGVREEWGKQYGSCPVPPTEEFQGWDLYDSLPKELHHTLDEVMATRGLFYHLKPIEGGRKALKEMETEGYELFLCTTPLDSNPGSGEEKIEWVRKHLGSHFTKKVIFTWDKTLVHASLLIDDKPVIKGLRKPEWEQILFTQPYNCSITDKRRLNSWAEWRSVIQP